MEKIDELIMMLQQMPSPAFFVQNGVITHCNSPARNQSIPVGTPIREIMITGHQEYEAYENGCMYLTLKVQDRPCAASINRIDDIHYFVLEEDADIDELQSMALAAQELRGPLASVMTTADRLFPLTEVDETYFAVSQLAQINRGLYQMLRIISNMSDAYRYTAGTAPQLETRDVGSLIDEWMNKSIPLIAHTETQLHYAGLRETVYTLTDVQMLERGVHNILSNALKFSPRGSAIDARLTRRGNMLFLTVTNNDPGAKDFPSNIFHHFRRKPGVGDSEYGIGLGMVLIRCAAAAHGGTVLLEHKDGQYSRITMSMAIRQSADTQVRSPILLVDYAGERDHALVELSENLPAELYRSELIN